MHNTDGSARDMKLFKLQTIANSALWCLGMALFYPMVYDDEKTIVTMIMAGSLAIGTIGYSHAPHAAFTYLGIQTVGNSMVALMCALMMGGSVEFLVAALSLVVGVSVFNATLERGTAMLAAFQETEEMSEKSECD